MISIAPNSSLQRHEFGLYLRVLAVSFAYLQFISCSLPRRGSSSFEFYLIAGHKAAVGKEDARTEDDANFVLSMISSREAHSSKQEGLI